MKKILAYTFAAVILGIFMMLAPFALFIGEPDTGEIETQTERSDFLMHGLSLAPYPSEFLFIVFMLILSLIIALGVRRFFMRKIAF